MVHVSASVDLFKNTVLVGLGSKIRAICLVGVRAEDSSIQVYVRNTFLDDRETCSGYHISFIKSEFRLGMDNLGSCRNQQETLTERVVCARYGLRSHQRDGMLKTKCLL